MRAQLTLFDEAISPAAALKASRAGTFVDNLALPVHRWFRYSAGFAAQWAEQVLQDWGIGRKHIVLDPFAGSGTVSVVCDTLGIPSVGIEAHPVVARISKAKLLWSTPIDQFDDFAAQVLKSASRHRSKGLSYPSLIHRSFDDGALAVLDGLKASWLSLQDKSPESELVWLALTAILRPASKAGTAQWQYILPNKTKKKVLPPTLAFQRQVEVMKSDMRWIQTRARSSVAEVILGDARTIPDSLLNRIDAVITSPPYANNYDYADALRFEMTFWGDINGWGDIHDSVRKYLIVSSSQHSSRERLKMEVLLNDDAVVPIKSELRHVVETLAVVREDHGGKKHYHTMIAAYCRDISLVLRQLRGACKDGARMCWVIGEIGRASCRERV